MFFSNVTLSCIAGQSNAGCYTSHVNDDYFCRAGTSFLALIFDQSIAKFVLTMITVDFQRASINGHPYAMHSFHPGGLFKKEE